MSELLTMKAVVEILGVSKSTVSRYLTSGKLKGKKGKRGAWEVTEENLTVFIKKNEIEALDKPDTAVKKPIEVEKTTEDEKTEGSGPSKFIMNDAVGGF